jgi:hypothetical protein
VTFQKLGQLRKRNCDHRVENNHREVRQVVDEGRVEEFSVPTKAIIVLVNSIKVVLGPSWIDSFPEKHATFGNLSAIACHSVRKNKMFLDLLDLLRSYLRVRFLGLDNFDEGKDGLLLVSILGVYLFLWAASISLDLALQVGNVESYINGEEHGQQLNNDGDDRSHLLILDAVSDVVPQNLIGVHSG